MRVKYIGKCDKQDSIKGVGWAWKPGQIRDVTAEAAERLTQYSDTWTKLDGNDTPEPMGTRDESRIDETEMIAGRVIPTQTEKTREIGENEVITKTAKGVKNIKQEHPEAAIPASSKGELLGLTPEDKAVEEPLPVVDVHGMTEKEMIDYAQTKYNEKLDKRQSKETNRHKLIAMIARHEMDSEGKS